LATTPHCGARRSFIRIRFDPEWGASMIECSFDHRFDPGAS
jgi:hypothetical protein